MSIKNVECFEKKVPHHNPWNKIIKNRVHKRVLSGLHPRRRISSATLSGMIRRPRRAGSGKPAAKKKKKLKHNFSFRDPRSDHLRQLFTGSSGQRFSGDETSAIRRREGHSAPEWPEVCLVWTSGACSLSAPLRCSAHIIFNTPIPRWRSSTCKQLTMSSHYPTAPQVNHPLSPSRSYVVRNA